MNKNVYIIAELSANHNNDLQLAKDTILAMKESGADAVKFQTYKAESLSLDVDNKYFGVRETGLWKGWSSYALYKEASMPYEWQKDLASYAISLGLDWLSSPFDFNAVDFLESINCPAYKIASFEIQDIPLIKYVAKKGKPIIISTGIATKSDIDLAVETCKLEGNSDITLLKCTSAYPSPFNEINLKNILDLSNDMDVSKVGLSDHTLGHTVALGAVALGATVVEKHFILDRKLGGVDSSFSMEPEEFKEMVSSIRNLELALGNRTYELTEKALDSRERGRSLFVCENIKEGDLITSENIRSVRPAAGLHPKHYYKVLGKTFNTDIKKGEPLSFDVINMDDGQQ